MAKVHPTAIVEPAAELADDVEIGPYSIVRGGVVIGAGSVVGPHCVIEGRTTIGRNNRIWQFNSIGGAPHDKNYAGEDTALVIGDGNTIREFCTISTGTVQDSGATTIGDDNWIMNSVHIAHDCVVGSHTIIAGYAEEAKRRIAGLASSEPEAAQDVALMTTFLAAATRGIAR